MVKARQNREIPIILPNNVKNASNLIVFVKINIINVTNLSKFAPNMLPICRRHATNLSSTCYQSVDDMLPICRR